MEDVLHVPNAYKNIVSISSLTRKGYKFLFSRDVCKIHFGNELVDMGYLIHGLYYVDNMSNNNKPQTNMSDVNAMLIENSSNSKYLWHLRLCHITEDRIMKLERMGILSNLESASNPVVLLLSMRCCGCINTLHAKNGKYTYLRYVMFKFIHSLIQWLRPN